MTSNASGASPGGLHPDLQWALGRLARARAGAAVNLVVLLLAGLAAAGAGVFLARPSLEVALCGVFSALALAGGIAQWRLAARLVGNPGGLGRGSWRSVQRLLWSLFGAWAAICAVSLIHIAITGQVVVAPIYGAVLVALGFAGPCGALLDASRVATLITGR